MRLGKFFAFAFLLSGSVEAQNQVALAQCKGTVYLTFDTGSQSQAELIAQTLRKHQIKATFFLANEKTVNGDFSLDPSWATFWKNLAADGHVFGNHTFDHVYVVRDLPDGRFQVKPQFGTSAGKTLTWNAQDYCKELQRVERAFTQLTGKTLSHYWRAPGGKLTPHLVAAAKTCGYTHVAWAAAGFSGDELPREALIKCSERSKFESRSAPVRLYSEHHRFKIWSRSNLIRVSLAKNGQMRPCCSAACVT